MTRSRSSRAAFVAFACTAALVTVQAAVQGCGPRGRTPVPIAPVADEGVVESDSDGVVAGAVYQDVTAGLDLGVPAGWRASPRFRAGRSGPPPSGSLRVRLEDGTGCLIDVSVEPAPDAALTGEPLRRDRELFFFSVIEEPAPQFAFESIWTASFVPSDATRLDVGYWIRRAQDGANALVRIEGRFPLASVTRCKATLDDVVRSLRAHERAISRE